MRMRHLRYFLTVAEELSFVRAAAKVHIEPSPLSRAIKELEIHLGVRLLDRNKGRLQLTNSGKVFREEAHRILTLIEAARVRVLATSNGASSHLRIGLEDGLAQPRIAQLLARCREEEPRTNIRVIQLKSNDLPQALQYDQIDLGFTLTALDSEEFIQRLAWEERPAAAIPIRHPLLSLEEIPLSELLRYPLILSSSEQNAESQKVLPQWLHDQQLPKLKIAESATSHEAMMMLVSAGYGVTVGLESQLALYRHQDVIVRPLSSETPDVPTFALVLNRPLSDELQRFLTRMDAMSNEQ
ncbi:LysR family transcriptional regulator [Pseudomonas sp. TNT2022 ID357]|uniref:LysR family transcriptional regulator n=1 Tax=Pseudomonas idahonensis TaxID=2942628 RepID=A0ABT5QEQ4_9PSED|nr:LysR family transcriptional regulator [Pseudomonas idahonensis]MDD1152697.1 LysR family transcriptional regulator [Pseudomonas idahonensis]